MASTVRHKRCRSSLITAAALPHLKASNGMIAYLSSVSASLTSPWPGLAAYTVTKAALDKSVEAWRAEHPEVGFTRLIVWECSGGEGDATSRIHRIVGPGSGRSDVSRMDGAGTAHRKLMDVEHFISGVHALVQCGSSMSIPTIAMTPRRPI